MRIVHLPFYDNNPYQSVLMEEQRKLGHEVWEGGGGGNFFRTAWRKWKPDVLHFHWLHPYLLRPTRVGSIARATRFLLEVAALRQHGSRVVWTVHNLTNHDRHLPGLERFFTTRFARGADALIMHSEFSLAAAEKAFCLNRNKLKAVIPQGSYVGCYPNTISKTESRKALNLPSEGFVFVFLGRIEPYKGTLELIQAFKQLNEQAHLVIAGRTSQPEMSKVLHDAIGDTPNIHLHDGFVSEDRLQLYLNAADVYVYPVRNILNSGSIPLAMSFGLPCIAPRVGGVLEAMGENGGLLYEPGNPDGLLLAMRQALHQKPQLAAVGAANLARATDWNWAVVAEQTLRVYNQCIDR